MSFDKQTPRAALRLKERALLVAVALLWCVSQAAPANAQAQSTAPRTTQTRTDTARATTPQTQPPTQTPPQNSTPTPTTTTSAPETSPQTSDAGQSREAAGVSPEDADLAITATVTARELRFEVVPNPTVEFPGKPRRNTLWEADRQNLPPQVRPGETYRDIGVRLRIVSVFADIDRIVAEALGERPVTDDAKPSTPSPSDTKPATGTPSDATPTASTATPTPSSVPASTPTAATSTSRTGRGTKP